MGDGGEHVAVLTRGDTHVLCGGGMGGIGQPSDNNLWTIYILDRDGTHIRLAQETDNVFYCRCCRCFGHV